MQLSPALSRAALLASAFLVVACNRGDVGAPCNHGSIEPPPSSVVTFPALSCDDLLCVYGEEKTIPTVDCQVDADCNSTGAEQFFECVIDEGDTEGSCTLALEYVLRRSMCSKRCESDDDCKDTGVTQRPIAKETACRTGFACARIMKLGELCCEKLCVCKDELPNTSELDMGCANNTQPTCCTGVDVVPTEGCGKP